MKLKSIICVLFRTKDSIQNSNQFFFFSFFKFGFQNVRMLVVDYSAKKSFALRRFCLKQTFLCNILYRRPVIGIVMMVIKRCGCTMLHYFVTSKALHIVFSSLCYKSASRFPQLFHQLKIEAMVEQPRLHKSQIRFQILSLLCQYFTRRAYMLSNFDRLSFV